MKDFYFDSPHDTYHRYGGAFDTACGIEIPPDKILARYAVISDDVRFCHDCFGDPDTIVLPRKFVNRVMNYIAVIAQYKPVLNAFWFNTGDELIEQYRKFIR